MQRILLVLLLYLYCNLSVAEPQVEVQWLGHAAFKISSVKGKSILIDPFLSQNPKTPEKLKHYNNYEKVKLILVTHAHADHVGDAIDLSKKFDIPVYAPAGLNDTLVSLNLLPSQLSPRFNKGGSIYPFADELKITMTHAEHSSEFKWQNPESGKSEIHVGGEPVGFIVKLENGFTIYHMGDTGLFGDMEFIGRYYQPDLVLIPIGGHYVMEPVDAAYAIKEYLKPKFVVPMHYGTFPALSGTVAQLNEALKGSNSKVFEMVPGDIINF